MTRILIAGAGIAGLALKHALAGAGLDAEVVEQDPIPRTTGAGLYLPANAVRALADLGLAEPLAARSVPVRRQEIRDWRGALLSGIDVRAIWGEVGDCLAIRRADLHDLLLDAAGRDTVRFGAAVQSVHPDGTVVFDQDRPGPAIIDHERYDLIVGADGIDSAIRGSVFPHSRAAFLGQVCWRFLAPYDGPAGTWTATLGSRGRTFLTLPLGDGEAYCFAAVNSANPYPPAGDWRDLFADLAGPFLEHGAGAHFAPLREVRGDDLVSPREVRGDDSVSPREVRGDNLVSPREVRGDNLVSPREVPGDELVSPREVPGDELVSPRVVLIGDAAHGCSPSMAQGGAMALEDALVLASMLARGGTAGYADRRRDRIRFVLEQNHRRDRARNLPGFVRAAVFRRFGERIVRANHARLLDRP